MPHVRTQLRNAVKTRLSTVSALKGVHDIVRLEQEFQSDNLPVALVSLSERAESHRGSFEGRTPVTRSYQVAIKLGVQSDTPQAEDVIDALCVPVEQAMRSSAFGIGAVQNWRYIETSELHAQPCEGGFLTAKTLIYSGEIQTLDSEPDRNLHP